MGIVTKMLCPASHWVQQTSSSLYSLLVPACPAGSSLLSVVNSPAVSIHQKRDPTLPRSLGPHPSVGSDGRGCCCTLSPHLLSVAFSHINVLHHILWLSCNMKSLQTSPTGPTHLSGCLRFWQSSNVLRSQISSSTAHWSIWCDIRLKYNIY